MIQIRVDNRPTSVMDFFYTFPNIFNEIYDVILEKK